MNGIPSNLRKKVTKRHFSYAFIYSLMMIEVLKNFYWDQSVFYRQSFNEVFELVLSISGFFLATIRLSEPYVFNTIKVWLQEKLSFCFKKDSKK